MDDADSIVVLNVMLVNSLPFFPVKMMTWTFVVTDCHVPSCWQEDGMISQYCAVQDFSVNSSTTKWAHERKKRRRESKFHGCVQLCHFFFVSSYCLWDGCFIHSFCTALDSIGDLYLSILCSSWCFQSVQMLFFFHAAEILFSRPPFSLEFSSNYWVL